MAYTYNGTDGNDTVRQNYTYDYDNIYTYGGRDNISLKLTDTYVVAGAGNDMVRSRVEGDNDIVLGTGNDTYVGNGFSTDTNFYDLVHGGSGNDKFTVTTNVSEYYGDSGNDEMSSAGYRNYFVGGAGVDTISYMAQDNDDFLSGTGVEVDLRDEYATTGSDRVEDVIGFENIKGTSVGDNLFGDGGDNAIWGMGGNDLINGRLGDDRIHGGYGADDINGGGGADRIWGDGGNDRIAGGAGNDRIDGGSGNDKLNGGDGNDVIRGNRGTDMLMGARGADVFVFGSTADSVTGSDRDVISDFSRAQGDRIDLSEIDAISGGGDNDFRYIGSANFQEAGDLHFRNHLLTGDVNGDGEADFAIRIADVDALKQSDFIL